MTKCRFTVKESDTIEITPTFKVSDDGDLEIYLNDVKIGGVEVEDLKCYFLTAQYFRDSDRRPEMLPTELRDKILKERLNND